MMATEEEGEPIAAPDGASSRLRCDESKAKEALPLLLLLALWCPLTIDEIEEENDVPPPSPTCQLVARIPTTSKKANSIASPCFRVSSKFCALCVAVAAALCAVVVYALDMELIGGRCGLSVWMRFSVLRRIEVVRTRWTASCHDDVSLSASATSR